MSAIVSDPGRLIRGEINLRSIIKATQGGNNLSRTDARQELQEQQDTQSYPLSLYLENFGETRRPSNKSNMACLYLPDQFITFR